MSNDPNYQEIKPPKGIDPFEETKVYPAGSLIFSRNNIDYICKPHSPWYSTASMMAHSFINEQGRVEKIYE